MIVWLALIVAVVLILIGVLAFLACLLPRCPRRTGEVLDFTPRKRP